MRRANVRDNSAGVRVMFYRAVAGECLAEPLYMAIETVIEEAETRPIRPFMYPPFMGRLRRADQT